MHLTIVGGCFPVQYNILPERLYHYTLRAGLAAAGSPWPGLAIVRYERLSTCLAKLKAAHAQQPTQVVLFHVRAEPVLRLTKLYYRYLDDTNRVRHSLNVPWGRPGNPEQYDLLTRRQPPPPLAPPPETRRHQQLRQLNLQLGTWAGNRRRALHQYQRLVLAIADFCRQQGIQLLLIGPVSRPCGPVENQLSAQLSAAFAALATQHVLEYLPTLGELDTAGQPLFFPNGIHVSPAGHDRIAQLLLARLQPQVPGQLTSALPDTAPGR